MKPGSARVGLIVASLTLPLWGRPTASIVRRSLEPTQVADSATIVLAEVLFAPATGDTSFVELAHVGTRAIDLSSFLLRIDTLELPLPRLASPVAPGARVLIRFDGRGTTEDNIVHASSGFGLRAEGGSVSLLSNDERVLDRIAWGDAVDAIMPPLGGIRPARLDPGSSFGRPPGANQPGANTDWVIYPVDQVTPGRPNPLPAVIQLLPLDGAILPETTTVNLGWYPVPGAVRYRMQLARDTTFAQTILDRTVDSPSVSSEQLGVGVYWWRVQAVPAEGTAAAWSRPSRIEFERRSGGGGGGDADGDTDSGGEDEGNAPSASGSSRFQNTAPVVLQVPLIFQHKDSKMLLLESQQSGGPRTAGGTPSVLHAWDRDHGHVEMGDPADIANCGLATMAMMNRYFRGDLTQDRIGYELFGPNIAKYKGMVPAALNMLGDPFRELAPGPERDLNYGYGISIDQFVAAGIYALGATPGPGSGFGRGFTVLPTMWGTIVAEIDAGRPVAAQVPGHLFVIRGYEIRNGQRLIYVNDPWFGAYLMYFDFVTAKVAALVGDPTAKVQAVFTWPSHPAIARLEPELSRDTDGDGVIDFDEVKRFHTDPNNSDSDADGVPDKQDIESGVYEDESRLGYAWNPSYGSPGRDFDADGKPTELDPDSDEGGCKDGEEDTSHDGYREDPERGNFNQADDECGSLRGNVSWGIDMTNRDPNEIAKEIHESGVILVRLKPESPGSDSYVDDSSTFNFRRNGRIEINLGNCTLVGRGTATGAGRFLTDAEIGATRGDDSTLAFSAGAPVQGKNSTYGCGRPPASGPDTRSMGFPDCTGKLDPKSPKGVPTYRFNCTTAPVPPGSGWKVTRYFVRGFIRLQ